MSHHYSGGTSENHSGGKGWGGYSSKNSGHYGGSYGGRSSSSRGDGGSRSSSSSHSSNSGRRESFSEAFAHGRASGYFSSSNNYGSGKSSSSSSSHSSKKESPNDIVSTGSYGSFTVSKHRDGSLTWSGGGGPTYSAPGTSGKGFSSGWGTGASSSPAHSTTSSTTSSTSHGSGGSSSIIGSTFSSKYTTKKSEITEKGLPLNGSWGTTAQEIAETLSKKHELEKKGFSRQDEKGQYKEHVFIDGATNTKTYVHEYPDGSRRTVKTVHEGSSSGYTLTKKRKEITVAEKKVNEKQPTVDIEKVPLGPHDKILPDGTIIHELEPTPKVLVDVARNLYTFGIEKIQIAHKKPTEVSGWISEEMEIGHSSYIEISAKHSKANASIEYYIIENNKEYPICPVEDVEIKNEKLFKGLPTRFTPHPDYNTVIKKNGVETQYNLHTIKEIDFGNDIYTIDYTPIRQSYHFFPEKTKVKVKIIQRCYDNYLPASIKSVVILKHGGGKLWSM